MANQPDSGLPDPGSDEPTIRDPLIGAKVGNYRITREIGHGGMGIVYLGEHPEIGTKVAIKVLEPHLAANQDIARRFIAEARAANQANHPGIIHIFDFGRLEDSRLYMVMEFLTGEELSNLLQRQAPLSVDQTRTILAQVADALDAAHRAGVVHRDLKPDNIFLHEQGNHQMVKILDFGIAKLVQPDLARANKTSTGMVMGTPLYMAPEQAAGQVDRISPRTDIYALGVILYQMLSAQLPFNEPNPALLLAAHITQPPTPLQRVGPHLPRAVCDVVMHCLEKDPDARYQSARELLTAFEQALTQSDGGGPPVVEARSGPVGYSAWRTSPELGNGTPSQPPPTGPAEGRSISDAPTGPDATGQSGADLSASQPGLPSQPAPTSQPLTAPSRGSSVKWMGISLAALALVAVALAWLQPWKKSGPKKAGTTATQEPGHLAGMATQTKPRPRADSRTRPAPKTMHLVTIKAKVPNVSLAIQVDSHPLKATEPPFSFQAPSGAHVHVKASRPGYRPQEQDFVVEADTVLDLVFDQPMVKRRGPARARKRHRSRKSHPRTNTARQPRPQPRARPVKPRPRPRPRRVGEGTLNLD